MGAFALMVLTMSGQEQGRQSLRKKRYCLHSGSDPILGEPPSLVSGTKRPPSQQTTNAGSRARWYAHLTGSWKGEAGPWPHHPASEAPTVIVRGTNLRRSKRKIQSRPGH